MNQATDHLTNAQIENYVSQEGTAQNPDAQRLQLEAHLADCESCLGRVLDAERIRLGLLEGDRMRKTPYPGCPAEETLQELAAGIAPSEMVEATSEHAAHCDFCGPLLARYMREFSDSLEEEDAALLAQLKSSKPGWQKKFVRKHIKVAEEKRGWSLFSGFWPKLATAGVAAVAVAFGTYTFFHHDDLSQAQSLVAAAYGERRTIEMRLPSAPHSDFNPIPVVKGPNDGGDWKSVPASLVEAEALLKQKNASGDLGPQWLQVEGRIDLLQGSSRSIDEAVDAFEKALARNPDNLGLKVDLATAYFEKEMRADHDRPVLVKTIDLLNDVLKNSQPDASLQAAALFDLAIAYEKTELRDLAVNTWKQYLQVDGTSDWAREARKHLESLNQEMPAPKQQGYTEPSYFLAHSTDPEVLQDLEEYQDIAMRSWLPVAIEDRSSKAGQATAKLAELLKRDHSDSWLQDFLSHTTGADLPATRMLSAAFTYDWNDLHHQAIRESHNAAAIFGSHHNLPGELRARYQEIYGLQRSLAGDDCLRRAEDLGARLTTTKYQWLKGQLALEKATCANMTFDFDTAAISMETSRKIANEFGFPELTLRVAGFDAGIQRGQENYDTAWKTAIGGLERYWQSECTADDRSPPKPTESQKCSYSKERLYQFYSVMQQCARKTGFHHTSEVLLQQGISILEDSAPDDVSLKATLYLRLADILSRQSDTDLADREAAKAEHLLKEFPNNDATAQIYAGVTRIELAEFELNRGNTRLALSKIEPLRSLLSKQDDFVKLDFYTAQGEIFSRSGQFDDAVKSYESGIQVAEDSLRETQDGTGQLNWVLGTGKTYRGLTRALLKLGDDRNALSVWERFQSRSLDDGRIGRLDRPTRTTESGFSYIPLPAVSQPHLIYATFEDGMQVWLVTRSQIHGQWLPINQKDLRSLIREFAKECADPTLSPDKASALYSLIFQPVIGNLPPSGTIAVELDEPLWGLSFEALRDQTGRYVGATYSVVYSPGLLAETSLRQSQPLTFQGLMLLVDASQSMEAAPLPGHSEEVDAVKNAFRNTKTIGPSVITITEIRSALAQSSEFHFSGHGKRYGTGTALVIGPELSLGAKDFAPERLRHLQLAVLSACGSGSAKKGTFDQSNLVRSFLAGGVPNVIASRWDVDARSTARFMQTFYDRLHAGEPAPQALQYAQAEMRAEKGHPYYWAAFNLTGRVN